MMTATQDNSTFESEIIGAFATFDADDSGYISEEQLKAVVTNLGERLDDDEIAAVIATCKEKGWVDERGQSPTGFCTQRDARQQRRGLVRVRMVMAVWPEGLCKDRAGSSWVQIQQTRGSVGSMVEQHRFLCIPDRVFRNILAHLTFGAQAPVHTLRSCTVPGIATIAPHTCAVQCCATQSCERGHHVHVSKYTTMTSVRLVLIAGPAWVQRVPHCSIAHHVTANVWVFCAWPSVFFKSGRHSELTNRPANFLSSSVPLTSAVSNGIAVR